MPTDPQTSAAPRIPPRKTGLAHLIAASRYSVQGGRRLWREAAFRHELLAAALLLPLMAAIGTPLWALALQIVLFAMLIATEALNTAIEELVDHVTSDWAEFAAHAKDLGSLAVMCLLIANAVWLVAAIWLALAG